MGENSSVIVRSGSIKPSRVYLISQVAPAYLRNARPAYMEIRQMREEFNTTTTIKVLFTNSRQKNKNEFKE